MKRSAFFIVLVYYETASSLFPSKSDVRFLLSGGAGTIKLRTGAFLDNIPSNQDLLLNGGAGIRWTATDFDDQVLHHLEASGAILILF